MDAATVKAELSTIVEALPEKESHYRELVKVPPEQRAEVWAEAVAEGEPTAKAIRAIAEKRAIAEPRQSPSGGRGGAIWEEAHQAMSEAATPPQKLSRERIEALYSQIGTVRWEGGDSIAPNNLIVECPGKTMTFRGLNHAAREWELYSQAWLGRWGKAAHARRAMTSANSHEHYTPKEVIDAVLECFGEIDLDPCSNSPTDGEPNIPAAWHFTKEDDGLAQNWVATNAFLNPPYSTFVLDENGDPIPCRDEKGAIAHNSDGSVKYKTRGCMGDWVAKLVEEYEAGHLQQAILLCKADTSTDWFQKIWQSATAVCFVDHRLKFHGTVEDGASATFASAIAYFGPHIEQFYRAFECLGPITQVINPEFFGE
jgi:hypothetical protein